MKELQKIKQRKYEDDGPHHCSDKTLGVQRCEENSIHSNGGSSRDQNSPSHGKPMLAQMNQEKSHQILAPTSNCSNEIVTNMRTYDQSCLNTADVKVSYNNYVYMVLSWLGVKSFKFCHV